MMTSFPNSLRAVALILAILAPCSLAPSSRAAQSGDSSGKHSGGTGSGLSAKSPAGSDDDLEEYSRTADIADPIQPVNRGTFWVNHQVYHYVFHPLLAVYRTVFPGPVRNGIHNVFDNLQYPDRFVNDLLQARFERAGKETAKFVVNTTAGVGGIMKVSERIPWTTDVPPEDTGLTFARWGIGHGPYVVIPIIGPRSLRDTVGFVGDYALSPTSWIFVAAPGAVWPVAVTTPDGTRTADERITTYETVTHNTLDRYLAVRTSYAQSRMKAAER